jgi:hypothetical protein
LWFLSFKLVDKKSSLGGVFSSYKPEKGAYIGFIDGAKDAPHKEDTMARTRKNIIEKIAARKRFADAHKREAERRAALEVPTDRTPESHANWIAREALRHGRFSDQHANYGDFFFCLAVSDACDELGVTVTCIDVPNKTIHAVG